MRAKVQIHSLDALRGIAALCVTLYHVPMLFGVGQALPHAYIAVDFFFVLSGFILFYRYGESFEGQPKPVAGYVIRRLARLYPLYLLATLIGIGLVVLRFVIKGEPFSNPAGFTYAVMSGLLMIPAWGTTFIHANGPAFPFADQAWSVFWEMVLSVLFILWVRIRLRGLWVVVGLAFGLLILATLPAGRLDGGWQPGNFHIGGLRAICGFCMGILVAKLYFRLSQTAIVARPRLASGVVLGLMGLVALYLSAPLTVTSLWVELALLAGIFPAMVLICALYPPRFLNVWFLQALGGASYSLYLLHGVSAEILIAVMNRVPALEASFPLGLAWLLATLAVAYGVWRGFEVPARQKISQVLSPRPAFGAG